jgi:multicomponent Na+:H+ antiporter subunit B
MSIIVKTIARVLFGLIILYGAYIVSHGHLTPGGGFAGGVMLTSAFVLLILAFGLDETRRKMSENLNNFLEGCGILAFLGIALFGLIFAGFFFKNFLPKGQAGQLFSAGIILPCNIAIAIKVCAGLLAIFIALVIFGRRR